jgi:hypothetical protein
MKRVVVIVEDVVVRRHRYVFEVAENVTEEQIEEAALDVWEDGEESELLSSDLRLVEEQLTVDEEVEDGPIVEEVEVEQ